MYWNLLGMIYKLDDRGDRNDSLIIQADFIHFIVKVLFPSQFLVQLKLKR